MGRCIIVGAAEYYGNISVSSGDFVIAADGGYLHLASRGITPDLVVGDFDSLSCEIPSSVEKITYPVEKDDTDMRLCYLEGRKRGYSDFLIIGGAGGRIDHTLANFSLMLEIAVCGGSAVLTADDFDAYVISNSQLCLPAKDTGTVSVFSIGGDCSGVFIDGLKYNAENILLKEGYALGVSNSFIGREARISVREGKLLVIVGKGY